jgi:lysozyme
MKMTPEGIAFLVSEEGLRTKMYKDVVGIPTIGVGHVILPNEQHLLTATLSRIEVMNLLEADISARFGPGVTKRLTRPATPNQLAAMISLCFNIGTAGFAQSGVCRLHNAGVTDAAAITTAFSAWCKVTVKGQKVVNAGLLARRKREAALYLQG